MKAKEPCGCVHDGSAWLKFCDAHRTEQTELHLRWWAEHIARQPPGTYLQLEAPPQ